MKEQTAVDYLMLKSAQQGGIITSEDWVQAKEIEKEQIINSYRTGKVNGFESQVSNTFANITAEDYYKEKHYGK